MKNRSLSGQSPGSPTSRRAFLRRAAAFAVGAPLLGLVRPAHGAEAVSGRASGQFAPILAAPSAALVVAMGAAPANLNPLIQTGLVEASVQMNIYDTLVFPDADGSPMPALAEAWQVLDDRTWEFQLRPGV
ncbi:MAG: hypothetical protein AB7P40_32165, partial [Chloroflexota bacterium]